MTACGMHCALPSTFESTTPQAKGRCRSSKVGGSTCARSHVLLMYVMLAHQLRCWAPWLQHLSKRPATDLNSACARGGSAGSCECTSPHLAQARDDAAQRQRARPGPAAGSQQLDGRDATEFRRHLQEMQLAGGRSLGCGSVFVLYNKGSGLSLSPRQASSQHRRGCRIVLRCWCPSHCVLAALPP